MAEFKITAGSTLWDAREPQPRFVWVACSVNAKPGHARPVLPHRLTDPDDPLLCDVCREPQRAMSKSALARYLKSDRRCEACRSGDHEKCCGVGCYRCPPEFHPRAVGVVATRTPGPK